MLIYTNKLGELSEVAKPEHLGTLTHSLSKELDYIAQCKKEVWANRKITTMYGDKPSFGNLGEAGKCVALVPRALLEALLKEDPDLVRDDHKWAKFLAENSFYDMSKPI